MTSNTEVAVKICRIILLWLVAFVAPTICYQLSMMQDIIGASKHSGKCDLNTHTEIDEWKPFPGQKGCHASLFLVQRNMLTLQRLSQCETTLPNTVIDEAPLPINYTLGSISGALDLEADGETAMTVYMASSSRTVKAKFRLPPCTLLSMRHNVEKEFSMAEPEDMLRCVLDAKKATDDVGIFAVNEKWWKKYMVHGYSRRCFVTLTDEMKEVILPRNATSELILTVDEDSSVYVVESRRQMATALKSLDLIYKAFQDANTAKNSVDGGQLTNGNRTLIISFVGDKEHLPVMRVLVTFIAVLTLFALMLFFPVNDECDAVAGI